MAVNIEARQLGNDVDSVVNATWEEREKSFEPVERRKDDLFQFYRDKKEDLG